MTEFTYTEQIILGKGTKAKELVGSKYTQGQVNRIIESTFLSVDEILNLSEAQFDAVITRLNIN